MITRIFLSMLFFVSVSAMQKPADLDQASRQLYYVMIRASNIINGTSLLGNIDGFDPSEKSLLSHVQSLINQGADPNYKLAFMMPMGIGQKHGIRLPTSMELAQKLNYQEIVNLFSTKKIS